MIGDHPFDGVWPSWNYLAMGEPTCQILSPYYAQNLGEKIYGGVGGVGV